MRKTISCSVPSRRLSSNAPLLVGGTGVLLQIDEVYLTPSYCCCGGNEGKKKNHSSPYLYIYIKAAAYAVMPPHPPLCTNASPFPVPVPYNRIFPNASTTTSIHLNPYFYIHCYYVYTASSTILYIQLFTSIHFIRCICRF